MPSTSILCAVRQDASLFRHVSRSGCRLSLFTVLSTILISGISLLPVDALAAPELATATALSREGYFVLSWNEGEASGDLVLQLSESELFNDATEWSVSGADQFTQSGLDNGLYYFRLQDAAGDSNIVQVRVEHHSLGRAVLFFSLGAALFFILLITIVSGRLRTGASEPV